MLFHDLADVGNLVSGSSWVRRLNILLLSIIPNSIYELIAIPVKISTGFKMYFYTCVNFLELAHGLKNIYRITKGQE